MNTRYRFSDQIWDTAGQEKFQSIGSAFYRGSDACVLVYDTTNAVTLDKLESWKKEFINQGGIDDPNEFPFIVVGNKSDRMDKAVDLETAKQFGESHGDMPCFETSAKEGTGIPEAMEEVVRRAAQQKRQEEEIFIPRDIDLGKPTEPQTHGGNCGC